MGTVIAAAIVIWFICWTGHSNMKFNEQMEDLNERMDDFKKRNGLDDD